MRLLWLIVFLAFFAVPSFAAESTIAPLDLTSLRKQAEQGDAEAQNSLGVLYAAGQGVTQDYAEAAKWFRKAAGQGNVRAQNSLGALYAAGQGVTQDYAEAAKWFRKAADQGNARAQYNLGICYVGGQGVPQDYAEAAKWFRKAADQGNANAQYNLGVSYFNGKGVTQDYEEAYFWLILASTSGDKNSVAFRGHVQRGLTRQQISAIQQRARDWKPTPAHPPASDMPVSKPSTFLRENGADTRDL